MMIRMVIIAMMMIDDNDDDTRSYNEFKGVKYNNAYSGF